MVTLERTTSCGKFTVTVTANLASAKGTEDISAGLRELAQIHRDAADVCERLGITVLYVDSALPMFVG